MDPFAEERNELTGSLISIEFGQGGRINYLWASDPALPEEGDQFQFVLPPLAFGEEMAEDYHPGTVLLGARTDPEEPWILTRNRHAQRLLPMDEDNPDDPRILFDYDFPLLPDLRGRGEFFELPGPIPQIVWELEIRNRGRSTVEIGELGFPLALNNFYDGFGWSDEQLRRLWNSRLYIHQFIGGAASWVFAQRMTAQPPSLLIFPGEDTGWEFFAHVPSSLNTPFQWEGIPVVYVHSRATVEREGWQGWANEHTSLILEPGDSRRFQMRFVPVDTDKMDGVFGTLAICGRPAFHILPSAVAPVDVGIAVEVAGATPTRFFVSRDAEMETDSDEEGGFCFVKPKEPGPLRLSVEDSKGRLSHIHLMFTERIESLIKKRARWIVENQICSDQTSLLFHAILMADADKGELVLDPDEYAGSSGIESSLADALFLAEKNTIYPVREEIHVLDRYIRDFLLDDVQNPGDMSVGSVLWDGTGTYVGRPLNYPHVFNLYHAMYRIANTYGSTASKPKDYLQKAARTAVAMFRYGWRHYVRTVGLLGYARIYDILNDLRAEGMHKEIDELMPLVLQKAQEMVHQTYPYAGESVLDTSGFEEVYSAARLLDNDERMEHTLRCAYAARSLSPSWWWYGSDKRNWDGADSSPIKALTDRGEVCLAHTTIPNSLMFIQSLDRDYIAIPDAYLRLAFGGMLGPWALVRKDGAASMCYCPDLSSKHAGYNSYTGSSGLGYFHYLRAVGAYVLPNRQSDFLTFGCHFDHTNGTYFVRPWDGVGRRIMLRQIGAEFELNFGKIVELSLDVRKRWAEIVVENPADKEIRAELRIRGLWGNRVSVMGRTLESLDGEVVSTIVLPPNQTLRVGAKVLK